MEDKACVLGFGTVGQATALSFGIKKYYSRSKANITLEEAANCRYIFICLPTPTVNGKCFTDDIYETIKTIAAFKKQNIFIIRSTVYPGFSRDIQKSLGIKTIVSNPEFLSEDTANEDAKQPDLIVLGGDQDKYLKEVAGLYAGRFKYSPTYVTDSVTAELIKYTLNAFFATKVVFANTIYDYTRSVGGNYETVKTVLEKHPWGSKNHFRVFDKGGRGAGGKCLQKDLESIMLESNSAFFNAVKLINEQLLKDYPKER